MWEVASAVLLFCSQLVSHSCISLFQTWSFKQTRWRQCEQFSKWQQPVCSHWLFSTFKSQSPNWIYMGNKIRGLCNNPCPPTIRACCRCFCSNIVGFTDCVACAETSLHPASRMLRGCVMCPGCPPSSPIKFNHAGPLQVQLASHCFPFNLLPSCTYTVILPLAQMEERMDVGGFKWTNAGKNTLVMCVFY